MDVVFIILLLGIIAVLTGAVGRANKRSLIVRFTVSGQAPCSGAERRNKVLDEVSTAILGGAAAENKLVYSFLILPSPERVDNQIHAILGCFLAGYHSLMIDIQKTG